MIKGKKSKVQSDKAPDTNGQKSPAFILSLNILLTAIIIFLSYSLYGRMASAYVEEEQNENIQPHLKLVQVEVLNGCGAPGVADLFTEYLRNNNFDVVQLGNYRSFDVDNSLVIDRTGNKVAAEKLADVLGINKKFIISQVNKDYFIDASLIIGKDFHLLKPKNKR